MKEKNAKALSLIYCKINVPYLNKSNKDKNMVPHRESYNFNSRLMLHSKENSAVERKNNQGNRVKKSARSSTSRSDSSQPRQGSVMDLPYVFSAAF